MASSPVKVSVIIPIYNAGKILGRMLDSLLAQTEQSFEVICVDDGSSDDGATDKVLSEYVAKDSRIHVLHQKNQGAAVARNLGLQNAQGKYVYVCDQDDYCHRELLSYCLWVAESYNVPFVAFRYGHLRGGESVNTDSLIQYGKIPIAVADENNAKQDVATYRKAHCFHTDCWVQFTTTELARTFPFALDRGLTRPFTLLKAAKRWAVSEAVLYFYNPDVATSMMHKPIQEKVLLAERSDMIAFWELYKEERDSGDELGIWQMQCKNLLINGLKQELNAIRREKRMTGHKASKEKWVILAETVRELLKNRRIPIRYVKCRHLLHYLWLMQKYQ